MRFDTNMNSTLDWKFTPEMKTLNLKPGEVHTVKFFVENETQNLSSGSASFNVSPSPFGVYLKSDRIGDFCASEWFGSMRSDFGICQARGCIQTAPNCRR